MRNGYAAMAVAGAILGFSALLVSTAALGQGASVAAAPDALTTRTLDVELGDLFIKPGSLSVPAGTDVTLRVHNGGGTEHDLTMSDGHKTPRLASGETAVLNVGAVASSITLFCSLPGHREAGMQAALAVEAGTSTDHTAHAAVAGASQLSMTPAQSAKMDASYLAGIKAFPAATKGEGAQLLAPRVENGVKVFDITASEIAWEVSPGETRQAMAYNGTVPGPTIHVALGDRVRIVLHNQLTESTAMHFHGLVVPNDMDGVPGITQPLVLPGQSFNYEFTVRNAGSHMYHSHMNAAVQVPAGLLGAFIVDGKDEPAVAHDEVMVLNDGPLGYTINGKGFPATHAIVAKQNELVRVRYMNEGLQIHPMHLHGLVQTVIAVDGNSVPQRYQQDTVMVAPGQRIDVLVSASELGVWAFHCHILSHAENEQGMYGMVTAFIVK
ncbi:MAG: copper oxidase [Chloroflexi bacterium]|nr:copper oxidase [Chloroflexota bacterium]